MPPCVNPTHLFSGTKGDNNRDCAAKGRSRSPRGSEANGVKLTEEAVIEIRQAVSTGTLQKDLCAKYGVSPMAVSQVVRRVTWKHIP
jgi:hypothetical protein